MITRPLMIYDADCGFCRRWIGRWRHSTGDRVDYEPFQSAAERFPDIPREDFVRAVHLIEPDGAVSRGADAVFRALTRGGLRWPLALYRHLPLFAPASEALYRTVARHRGGAERATTWLWGRHVVPPGEARTVDLFLRAMGVIFAVAFLSLWVQIIGLVGENGILPAGEFLEAVRSRFGAVRFWYLPTVFWFNVSDVALHAVCAAGVLCSCLLVAGRAPGVALFGAWVSYLSLLCVGQNFLRFQWDSLLVEAGAVALLMVPWTGRLRNAPPPRRALWLARWLLFRLMFTSAVVKLTSGDPTWRALTALDYHYFTQPLPPWTAWYAQHWPAWFQKLSVLAMFAVEGVVPFFIFGPRRVRFVVAGTIAGLQLLMIATGNYGFFNLLAIALCIPLLDDGLWMKETAPVTRAPGVPRWRRATRNAVVAVLFFASLAHLAGALRLDSAWLRPAQATHRLISPLHVVNPYGLFAVMTTDRPEIVIEGSRDGIEWSAYEFRYKPGDMMRRPRVTTPHMPRVDWQMWFAGLGDVQGNRWFLVMCWRLLQGAPEVRGFFAVDPFPDNPPRYIRANVYMYRFTTPRERHETDAWWTRSLRGPYVRTLMLQEGVLAVAPESMGL